MATIITHELITAFLEEKGWVHTRPGKRYGWKDPRNGITGYSLIAALENQLVYDSTPAREREAS